MNDLTDRQIEILKLAHSTQRDELKQYREQMFRLFSWSSSLLLAVVGILATYDPSRGIKLGVFQKVVLTIATTIIGTYVIDWQRRTKIYGDRSAQVITKIDEQLGLFTPVNSSDSIYPETWRHFGRKPRRAKGLLIANNFVLFILIVLAIIMIWSR